MSNEQTNQQQPNRSPEGELRELLSRADYGGSEAVMALRTYPKQHPDVWQHAGNLARLGVCP
jgi:hypothetical protein